MVSVVINQEKNEIFVEGCKFWPRKTSYEKIETDMARLHQVHNWQKIMIEVNGIGEHVYETMRSRHGLPVFPVTTVHKLAGDRILKNKAQRLKRSMPKNEMVMNFLKLKKLHMVKFPKDLDSNMMQLSKQLTAFSEKTTDSGNTTYAAPGNEHDDGVMALLLCLFAALQYIKITTPAHVGGTIPKRSLNPFVI